MVDRNLKLSLPIDILIDILLQVKCDRQALAEVMDKCEADKFSAIQFREDMIEREREEKNELEYKIIKLKSQIVELEKNAEHVRSLFPLTLSPSSSQTISEDKQVEKDNTQVDKFEPTALYPQRLVISQCKNCNNVSAMVMKIKDDELAHKDRLIICRHCQRELPQEKLKHGFYSCPNCSVTGTFYVMGEANEIKCKSCKADIDIMWHEKKKQYLSVNLFK